MCLIKLRKNKQKLITKKFNLHQKFPNHKWVFGMYCRQTGIVVVYQIKTRESQHILPFIKKHIAPGTVVYSDELSTYVCLQSAKSRLAYYGYYHYWICHSMRYTHEKLPFVHTMQIEGTWNQMKTFNIGIGRYKYKYRIQKVIEAFCVRVLIKKKLFHE